MASTEGISVTRTQRRPPTDLWALAPYPVIVADEAGTVVEANPAATLLLEGALPGARMPDVVPAWLARGHEEVIAHTRLPTGASPDASLDERVLPSVSGRISAQTYEAHATRGHDELVVWWLVDDTDRRLAEEALATERERTRFLAEASNILPASLNSDRCMDATAQLAAQYLADVAIVVTPRSGRRLPVAHAISGQDVTRTLVAADPTQVPGLSEALQGFPPVPSRWIDPATLPGWILPPGFTGPIRSVVVTPLPGHGVPAGAMVLLRGTDRAEFSENEEVFARLFAARAGAALSASRLYSEQSAITQTLMRDLLPPRLRHLHGVEFAGGYRPAGASERVGGDFYDIHPGSTEAEASLVVLGDVCGKGLDAAILTGKIRNTLQALTPMAADHERMLQLLNAALLTSHHTRFATMVMASVQRTESQVRLRLTSAGHPSPLVVRTDGAVEEVPTHGTLIGALDTIEAHTVEVILNPGETCLLYTDGFTEARGGPLGDELFGDERLKRALSECAGMSAEAVVERVQMLASQWLRDRAHDDMAVVAITAPRTTHLSAVNGHTRGRYTA
ncbi:SpoIIE family protein phosphatase [Streptomyces sp. NBC_00513]|uniref:PP2C family protein-serine/threonine phosphatase n=1 Tax=unclassified Streptomyces TaxID=2593676 RepID=UPI0022567589|nr:PP2C family protein-serine/threonine phosphatase [Streptomyces sp. NBC_00424]MCX5077421.1 SpoIIE family protein phosphatase [Streptomyces sp. NBC_00424]WUD39599.1 SpoIIE family protein phosphatase [Streptomyces sp. NBC_00513]